MKVLFHSPVLKFYPKAYRSWFNIEKEGIELDYFFTFSNSPLLEPRSENIAWKMEKARQLVLAQGYDFLFNVEADIVLPKNALLKLLNNKKDVISGLYRGKPSTFFNTCICARIYDPTGPQDSDDRYPEVGKDFQLGDIIECCFLCFGCILIAKNILAQISFKKEIDTDFSLDLQTLKVPMYLDTGVKCIHLEPTGEEIRI